MKCNASSLYLLIAVTLGLGVSFSLHAFTGSFLAENFNVANPTYRNKSNTPFMKVLEPVVSKEITSPLNIKGKASGEWFFEGVMQVEIWDSNDMLLGSGPVTATEDWMAVDTIGFEGVIPFDVTTEKTGFLIFKQEDPSGEGKRNALFKYPVFFKKQVTTGSCGIHECGSQVCSPEEGASCEWSPESVCYSKALCERQSNGLCGFTKTEAFKLCMNQL